MAQISSASQLPESLEAPRSHRPRLAGPPTSVATTLNGSETTSISVPPQSDLEPGQPGHDAVVDEIPNNSPQEDSWWNTDDPWSRDTVLTLDGGGVRGYSSLLILKAIMARVEAHEQRLDSNVECSAHPFQHRKCERIPPAPTRASTLRPNERNAAVAEANPKFLPAHYFNYIGGASTGGLIAIMLGRLSMTVEECCQAYEQLAHSIFGHPRYLHMTNFPLPGRPKYDHIKLENSIKAIVEEHDQSGKPNALFAQRFEDMCRTIVISWREAAKETRIPYLFRSYRHPRRSIPDPSEPGRTRTGTSLLERNPEGNIYIPIWKVARATSAAPSYFKAMKMSEVDESTFVDGGFGANNPAEEVYRSVSQMRNNRRHAIGELVSIGTGKKEPSGRKFYFRLLQVIYTAIKMVSDSEKTHERMLEKSDKEGFTYSRLNVKHGLGKMKLDAWKGRRGDQTLELMQTKTEEYLQTEEAEKEIDKVAMRLVQIRRSRAREAHLDRWEHFCHGVEYSCCVQTCQPRERMRAEHIRQHLQTVHRWTKEQTERSWNRYPHYPLFEPS